MPRVAGVSRHVLVRLLKSWQEKCSFRVVSSLWFVSDECSVWLYLVRSLGLLAWRGILRAGKLTHPKATYMYSLPCALLGYYKTESDLKKVMELLCCRERQLPAKGNTMSKPQLPSLDACRPMTVDEYTATRRNASYVRDAFHHVTVSHSTPNHVLSS